jgi:hypothetical protein
MIHSQHTLGPWYNFGPIIHAQGQHIAHVVCDKVHLDGDMGSDEQRANARVIKSAPELLEACQAVVDNWERGDLAAAARMCSQAIAKAMGRSSDD